MKKNGWDPKLPDFIWNKNRLEIEKQALKQGLMKVINKPIKDKTPASGIQGGPHDDKM